MILITILFFYWGCVHGIKSTWKVTVASFVVIWQNLSNHVLTSSKDSSRYLQTNYVISYLFYIHLMLHAFVERFDVIDGRGNILSWNGEVNKAWGSSCQAWWTQLPTTPSILTELVVKVFDTKAKHLSLCLRLCLDGCRVCVKLL
jgi:hypothetical protein